MTVHSAQLIPETAPFTPAERALLNDFFVRVFGLDKAASASPLAVQSKGPLQDGDDGAGRCAVA
jgi:spore maturation protein SpmA